MIKLVEIVSSGGMVYQKCRENDYGNGSALPPSQIWLKNNNIAFEVGDELPACKHRNLMTKTRADWFNSLTILSEVFG